MSSKFGQMQPLVSMATIVIMGKMLSALFDRIFFILAGNENIHNISNEFEIRPDLIKD